MRISYIVLFLGISASSALATEYKTATPLDDNAKHITIITSPGEKSQMDANPTSSTTGQIYSPTLSSPFKSNCHGRDKEHSEAEMLMN